MVLVIISVLPSGPLSWACQRW